MLIICHVCAEFHNKTGETIFSVTPETLNGFINAPDEIREDPLFGMLAADGSLEAITDAKQKRTLEKDPDAGINADGKKANTMKKKPAEPAVEVPENS